MNWEQIKMWVTNPITTYKDQRKIRQIEIARIEQNLKKIYDDKIAMGFDVMKAKDIKQKARAIYERDEKLRPTADLVQMIKDLRAGRKMRKQKEARAKRQAIQRTDDARR